MFGTPAQIQLFQNTVKFNPNGQLTVINITFWKTGTITKFSEILKMKINKMDDFFFFLVFNKIFKLQLSNVRNKTLAYTYKYHKYLSSCVECLKALRQRMVFYVRV